MSVPSVSDLKSRFPIASQIESSHLEFAIETALGDVEDAVGIDVYNQIFASDAPDVEDSADDADTTNVNEIARRLRRVTNAVYYRAFAKALRMANTRIRPSGSVKREQDAASPAMGGGRQTDNEYFTPKEVSEMASWWESEADAQLIGYLLVSEVSTFVEYELSR
jgi:hypothetical protein